MVSPSDVCPQSVVEIERVLKDYFPPSLLDWRPRNLSAGPGPVELVPVVDVRSVEERLDLAFGPDGWETTYRELAGNVECTLRVRFPPARPDDPAGGWVRRCDIGFPNLWAVAGDVLGATRSTHEDALVRAARQLGVGRYLLRMTGLTGEWDGKRVTKVPVVPEHFLPEPMRRAGPALADRFVKLARVYCEKAKRRPEAYTVELLKFFRHPENVVLAELEARHVRRLIARVGEDIAAQEAGTLPADWPQSGAELKARLARQDAERAKDGEIRSGDLLAELARRGRAAGYPDDLSGWDKPAQIRAAVAWVKEILAPRPAAATPAAAAATPAA